MSKKILYALIVLPVIVILAACASLKIPGISSAQGASSNPSNQQGGPNSDPSKMPVEQKLGIGILKLEGTAQAVTAQQAKDLLPLWKAVKTMATNTNTSPDEITALYKQIQGVLTPDQVQAIQKMTWTQEDLRATMQQYGVQFAQGFGGNGTPDPSVRATRAAQFQAQGNGTGNGRGGNGGLNGGGFNGAPGGGFGAAGGQGGTNARRTPVPGQVRRGGFGGGFNNIFADAVIKLLTQKSGS
jgi:hypothetical protein